MKIYFGVYNFTNTGMSGADQYHYHLAQLMLSWGWEVRSLNHNIQQPCTIDGVEVFPIAANGVNHHAENLKWCDKVITFPMPHKLCKGKPKIIVKHNDGKEPFDFSEDKILYCGQSVKDKLQMPCKDSFVWNPVNRYYDTDKRGIKDGKWIIVNCNENKGGARLIQLAKLCPDIQFAGVLGVYGSQITEPLPNLEYWPASPDMSQYYQKSAGLLSLSGREGFPTVVMEAMSHGLPVVGLDFCPGFMDVVKDAAATASRLIELPPVIRKAQSMYELYAHASLTRAEEIEQGRDELGLLNFLVE